jgi:AraC-like DNA-binding protein
LKKRRVRVSAGSDHVAPAAANNHGGRVLPFTRANAFVPFTGFLDSLGSPTQRLLQKARIPGALLEDPEALVPVNMAYRFLESAVHLEGIDDLGLRVAQQADAFQLGTYGTRLQRAKTVAEYLQIGISLIGSQSGGERFWLTNEGNFLRFNQFLPGTPGIGRCHADVFTLALTLNMLRRFIGPGWSPAEVCLLAGDEALLGDSGLLGEAALITGQDHSSFTIPRALLSIGVQRPSREKAVNGAGTPEFVPPMPSDLVTSVEHMLIALLEYGQPSIDVAAEIAGMSPRTLQRRLAEAGVTYSGLVTSGRMQLARDWLGATDMPVTEIAAALGYTDASNFARAFRAQTGLSPAAYRLAQQRD